MLAACLHRNISVSMLLDKAFQLEIGLAFPLSRQQEILLLGDFCLPLIVTSVLVSEGKKSTSPVFAPLIGLDRRSVGGATSSLLEFKINCCVIILE